MIMKLQFIGVMLFAATVASAQSVDASKVRFRNLVKQMPAEWFSTKQAINVADSVMKYQFRNGGWGKNQDWHVWPAKVKDVSERLKIMEEQASESQIGSTIDNKATTTEMIFLAHMYGVTKNEAYKQSFVRGLNYLLEAQYDNGGWPQFYPYKPKKNGKPFYSDHITFNDNAMYNVMRMFRDIYKNKEPYAQIGLSQDVIQKVETAYHKGIDCILKCQIRKDGKLTVWCQQHDEFTLEPAPARSFELVSFSGNVETANLLKLLMLDTHPSKEVINAVSSAVEWLKTHALKDCKIEHFTNADGKKDIRMVHQVGASPLWARYYDIETEKPFVCDRDGIKKSDLSEIGYERRNGYGWYGDDALDVFKKYQEWIEKVGK
jgi:PelA/Pel-15E family pectate lyase